MQISKFAALFLSLVLAYSPVLAIEPGTRDEAVALVRRAVAYMAVHGPEKSYADFSNLSGQFVTRNLYVVVYDMNGKCLAHGQNNKLIGRDLYEVLDADGKAYVKERVELAKNHASFWQKYKFSNPTTKKISPKETYCQHAADGPIICAGIYPE